MKKIIFCLQTMVLGGVEKELITIMKKMMPQEYDVSLLLFYKDDLCILEEIPRHVKMIDLDIDKAYYCSSCVQLSMQRLKRGKIVEAVGLMAKRVFGIGMTYSNTDISEIAAMKDEYDVAICFHMHSPLTLRYVAEKIKAKKKITWIHNDFLTTGFPVHKLKKYIAQYDEIIAVSEQVKKEFDQLCPQFTDHSFVCHNIIDSEEILRKSEEPIDDDRFCKDYQTVLLTVGRFCDQKGYDYAIKAARILKDEGVLFKWFFVGYGAQEQAYRAMIKEYGVEDCVVILGRKDNPYPYIKNCDIYVQPSRHEAYGIVIAEARVLHRPIICSRFAGAEEQIIDGKTGIIVPLNDVVTLAGELKKLINDPDGMVAFTEALANESALAEWYTIERHLI